MEKMNEADTVSENETVLDNKAEKNAAIPKRVRSKPKLLITITLLLIVLAGSFFYGWHYWAYASTHTSTDDAAITGDLYAVSSKVAGRIERVLIANNDFVYRGQLLATLDAHDIRSQLEQAQAVLVTEQANARAAGVNIDIVQKTAESATLQARANVGLEKAGEVAARQQAEAGKANIPAARAAVNAASAQITGARRQVNAGTAEIAQSQASVAAAQAGIDDALNKVSAAQADIVSAREGVNEATEGVKFAEQSVAGARAQLESLQGAVGVAEADITSAKAHAKQAKNEVIRMQRLYDGGATPKAQLEAAQETATTAQSLVVAAQQRKVAAQADVTRATAAIEQAQAGVSQAVARRNQSLAALARAEVNEKNSRDSVTVARAKLKQSQAQFKQARENVGVLRAGVSEQIAKTSQATASVRQSQNTYSALQASIAQQQARTVQAQAALKSTETEPDQINVSRAQALSARGRVMQALARVHELKLQLSYTKIYAPHDGVVSHKNVTVGQNVQNGQELLTVADMGSVFVTANFKETQLGDMHIGNLADIEVDAYPGKFIQGHILSFSAGTGAAFSLLPPDNASGNFTKVVQRVPVKISIDHKNNNSIPLRFGMSVVATVDLEQEYVPAEHKLTEKQRITR